MGTALAVVDVGRIAVLSDPSALETVIENLGGEKVNRWDLPHIKFPAGGAQSWEIPGPGGLDVAKEIRGVVIAVGKQRAYFKSHETTGAAPDCVSDDLLTGKGSPGGVCADCPMAQFGSASRGSGQACKETRLLYILLEGRIMPVVLSVPPTSLGAWKKYTLALATPHYLCETVISLVREVNAENQPYSMAVFQSGGVIPSDSAAAMRSYRESFMRSLSL